DNIKYFYTHGHRYDIKSNREVLSAHAANEDAQFAFYGHSHVALCESINGVYCINPGSISQTRGDWEETYAILEFDKQRENVNLKKNKKIKNLNISILNRNHKEIEKQSQDL